MSVVSFITRFFVLLCRHEYKERLRSESGSTSDHTPSPLPFEAASSSSVVTEKPPRVRRVTRRSVQQDRQVQNEVESMYNSKPSPVECQIQLNSDLSGRGDPTPFDGGPEQQESVSFGGMGLLERSSHHPDFSCHGIHAVILRN